MDLNFSTYMYFIYFYFEQYLFRGAQFSEAGLNAALSTCTCIIYFWKLLLFLYLAKTLIIVNTVINFGEVVLQI